MSAISRIPWKNSGVEIINDVDVNILLAKWKAYKNRTGAFKFASCYKQIWPKV